MIALLISFVQLTTPHPPHFGFAVDYDGSVLAARIVEQTVKVARYRIDGSNLREAKVFEPEFKGALEIMPKRDGFVVLDYEGGTVVEMSKEGKVRWQTRVRYPTIARMDPLGNVWAVFNSGYLMRKTPDSSVFEHILYPSGLEIAQDFAIDIVPLADGTFFTVQQDGEIHYFGPDKKFTSIAKVPTDRMIGSTLGGVLCYKDGVIRHVSRGGAVRELTRLPASISEGVRFFARAADGRLMVGRQVGSSTGSVTFLDSNIEK
jgi:hypothetical protein